MASEPLGPPRFGTEVVREDVGLRVVRGGEVAAPRPTGTRRLLHHHRVGPRRREDSVRREEEPVAECAHDVEGCRSHLVVDRRVAASTRHPAFATLLIIRRDRHGLGSAIADRAVRAGLPRSPRRPDTGGAIRTAATPRAGGAAAMTAAVRAARPEQRARCHPVRYCVAAHLLEDDYTGGPCKEPLGRHAVHPTTMDTHVLGAGVRCLADHPWLGA
jgi:hypothetical protein